MEQAYPFSPSGVFMTVAYGIPYFERLPGGFSGRARRRDTCRASRPNRERSALEEAVPGPTDVSPQNPGITKQRFNVPVQIESNDMLLTLRSDSSEILDDVLSWLTEAEHHPRRAGSRRLGSGRAAAGDLAAADVRGTGPAASDRAERRRFPTRKW